MATLKRYKISSEHNAGRYQDLPPRFKRQKSITSSKNQTGVMEPINQNTQPPRDKKSDSPALTLSIPPHAKGQFPREGRKIVKKLSPQKHQSGPEKVSSKPTQPFVLSPMENRFFNLMRDDDCENLDSVLAKDCSDNKWMAGLSTSAALNQQSSTSKQKSFSANLNNAVPPQHTLNSNEWYPKARPQVQPSLYDQNVSPQQQSETDKRSVDYSDPDIRTIEMLRELERVADQTDVGTEVNSNDKNSLVSHHLRMLMCAVDRYTQGVDDESDSSSSCADESLAQRESPVPSSSQSISSLERNAPMSPPQVSNKNLSQMVLSRLDSPPPSMSPQVSSADLSTRSSPQHLISSHMANVQDFQYVSLPGDSQSPKMLQTTTSPVSQQPSPKMVTPPPSNPPSGFSTPQKFSPNGFLYHGSHNPASMFYQFPQEPVTNAWGIWSSPSFNGLDVFSSLSSPASQSQSHVDDFQNMTHPACFFDQTTQFYARDSCN